MAEEEYMTDVKHLAIDLDDVILDFVDSGIIRCINREFDAGLIAERDITDWDLSKVLDPIVGGSWWDWWRKRDWLWAQCDAVPGAIGGLQKLRDAGHYLEVVTSKPEWAEAQTWRWLGKWRPPVHQVTIIGMGESKADSTDADIIIDDKPENCFEFLEDGRQAILFDRPHNRAAELRPGMDRVFNWRGMATGLEMLEYEEATT